MNYEDYLNKEKEKESFSLGEIDYCAKCNSFYDIEWELFRCGCVNKNTMDRIEFTKVLDKVKSSVEAQWKEMRQSRNENTKTHGRVRTPLQN